MRAHRTMAESMRMCVNMGLAASWPAVLTCSGLLSAAAAHQLGCLHGSLLQQAQHSTVPLCHPRAAHHPAHQVVSPRQAMQHAHCNSSFSVSRGHILFVQMQCLCRHCAWMQTLCLNFRTSHTAWTHWMPCKLSWPPKGSGASAYFFPPCSLMCCNRCATWPCRNCMPARLECCGTGSCWHSGRCALKNQAPAATLPVLLLCQYRQKMLWQGT